MDDERQVRQKLRVVPYHIEETVISTIADAVSRIQNSLKANYTSAIDPDFTERLDKALQKNLQYIKKCVIIY